MAKKSNQINVDIPAFVTDPKYTDAQNVLFPFGTNMLAGNVPDYYKSIGEYGGAELSNILGSVSKDITKAVDENLVRRNISRSGVGAEAVAGAVGSKSAELRWNDYLRAMEGKKYLLATGLDTVSNVRNSALDYGNSQNSYNMQKAGLQFNIATGNAQLKAQEAARSAQMWSSIIGAAGTVAGFALGGPIGAGIGGSIAGGSSSGMSTSLTSGMGSAGSFGGYNFSGSELQDMFNMYRS